MYRLDVAFTAFLFFASTYWPWPATQPSSDEGTVDAIMGWTRHSCRLGIAASKKAALLRCSCESRKKPRKFKIKKGYTHGHEPPCVGLACLGLHVFHSAFLVFCNIMPPSSDYRIIVLFERSTSLGLVRCCRQAVYTRHDTQRCKQLAREKCFIVC